MLINRIFIRVWTKLKVDPDATFKVSGIFEQFQNDFNKQQQYTQNQMENHYEEINNFRKEDICKL